MLQQKVIKINQDINQQLQNKNNKDVFQIIANK